MRISHINSVYGCGSTGTILKELQTACLLAGFDIEVIYSQASCDVPNGYHISSKVDNKIHSLLSRIAGKQGYYSKRATKKLLRHYDSQRPDIVHLHNLHSSYINVPMLLAYLAKNNIATVITLHDCWFYTGGCTHYTHSSCQKWKQSCGDCPQRYEEFPAYVYDSSAKILQDREELFKAISNLTVVGVSQWIKNEAMYKVFKNAYGISIYNGIDTDFFQPTANDFRKAFKLERKFLILAPANKWFLELNRETLLYFSNHLTDDMRIIFIGKGANNQLLTEKMLNIGFVSSREQLRSIYSAVDVMVNCTREESLSLLNIEVQSCGTPVITYSNSGVKETVDGKCGFAVENGSPESAWNAMMTIKKNTKEYYSEACQRWVKHEFEKNKNYRKYIELYKTIAGQ